VLGKEAPDDVRLEYEVGQVLGTGQFGVTRVAIHRVSGHKYACKSISKSNLSRSEAATIRQELQIMHHVAGVVGCSVW
jgi:calcium-dependent protein kinase